MGDPLAPIKHVRLAEISDNRELDMQILQRIADHVSSLHYIWQDRLVYCLSLTKDCFFKCVLLLR